jgi:hypothetical protein
MAALPCGLFLGTADAVVFNTSVLAPKVIPID